MEGIGGVAEATKLRGIYPQQNYQLAIDNGQSAIVIERLEMERWSTFSKTGVCGDPTKATREKGRKIFEASVRRLIELICEFQRRKILSPKNHH